ncbi:hypothetical protein GCM10027360_44630 [Amycolatopsis echigonensis]
MGAEECRSAGRTHAATGRARGEGDIRADRGKDTAGLGAEGWASNSAGRVRRGSTMRILAIRVGTRTSLTITAGSTTRTSAMRAGMRESPVTITAGGGGWGSITRTPAIRAAISATWAAITAGGGSWGSITRTLAIRAAISVTWAAIRASAPATPATPASTASTATPAARKAGATSSSKPVAAFLRGLPVRLDRPGRRIGPDLDFPVSRASPGFPVVQEAPAGPAGSSADRPAADGVRRGRCVRRSSPCWPRNPATATS